MASEVRPIRTRRDYEAVLKEVEDLWGRKAGTREGDRPLLLWASNGLSRGDVHALEALRVDRSLHHAGLFCFVDECRE
jgi:hypothetical protein